MTFFKSHLGLPRRVDLANIGASATETLTALPLDTADRTVVIVNKGRLLGEASGVHEASLRIWEGLPGDATQAETVLSAARITMGNNQIRSLLLTLLDAELNGTDWLIEEQELEGGRPPPYPGSIDEFRHQGTDATGITRDVHAVTRNKVPEFQ